MEFKWEEIELIENFGRSGSRGLRAGYESQEPEARQPKQPFNCAIQLNNSHIIHIQIKLLNVTNIA